MIENGSIEARWLRPWIVPIGPYLIMTELNKNFLAQESSHAQLRVHIHIGSNRIVIILLDLDIQNVEVKL